MKSVRSEWPEILSLPRLEPESGLGQRSELAHSKWPGPVWPQLLGLGLPPDWKRIRLWVEPERIRLAQERLGSIPSGLEPVLLLLELVLFPQAPEPGLLAPEPVSELVLQRESELPELWLQLVGLRAQKPAAQLASWSQQPVAVRSRSGSFQSI